MSGAAVRCDYPRNVGRRIAPNYLAVLNLFKIAVHPGKHDGAPAGTSVPADAMQGVSPMWICNLSRQFPSAVSVPPAHGTVPKLPCESRSPV